MSYGNNTYKQIYCIYQDKDNTKVTTSEQVSTLNENQLTQLSNIVIYKCAENLEAKTNI